MDMRDWADPTWAWLAANWVRLAITVAVAVVYFGLDRISTPKLAESADQSGFQKGSANKAIKFTRVIMGMFGGLIVAFVWGVDLSAALVFATTGLTLLGVALFASWSLLSNVTAYFILLVHPSFERGTFIRVIDADNYAEGYISELGLFSTKLVTENGEVIVYPNNLLFGRAIIVNPTDRLDGIGKLGKTEATVLPSGGDTLER
jgi:small-conductance mechanosensitive channel